MLLFLAVISSCIVETEPEYPIPTDEYFLELINKSSHTIEIERLSNGIVFQSYVLGLSESIIISDFYEREPIELFYVYGDSTRVIYDDDISVFHNREEVQSVSRGLMLPSSYSGGKVSDEDYEFAYEFTDADYDEAVELGG